MNHRDRVDALLAELCLKLGVPPVALSPAGTCAFDHRDALRLVLEVPRDSDLLFLHGVVALLPEKDAEPLLERLLALNLVTNETGGAVFGIDPRERSVVLCYRQPIALLDHVSFESLMENLIAALRRWRHELGAEAAERGRVGIDLGLRV